MSAEQTQIWFELIKENRDARNDYWTWLPFANINRRWENGFNLTLSWRRSIRRPGINELNPTIDFSDPYNLRFGNPTLKASTADNFDLVAGRTSRTYFINLGAGYNIVKDIFSRVRTLLPDGKTQITWENISGRKEYELSTWGGLTLAKRLKLNLSASYTYNQYSHFDRVYNYYRNGGSFTSNVNTVYTPKDVWNITGGFNFNRFANPQGYARWNWSMNAGVQRKFFEKRLAVTLNMIDPFFWQQTRVYTYGPGFAVESYNATRTSNFRLSLGYSLTKPAKKVALPAKK
jgi:outer membrane receptor protein involved in Fe transport